MTTGRPNFGADESAGLASCEHEDIEWLSGEPGVVIALNGPIAARCRSCGTEATASEE